MWVAVSGGGNELWQVILQLHHRHHRGSRVPSCLLAVIDAHHRQTSTFPVPWKRGVVMVVGQPASRFLNRAPKRSLTLIFPPKIKK